MHKNQTRAFTLIELMIVVTIISILSSIAIPNLLRARMSTNEVAAVATLKDIHTGQTIYRRTDWNQDGIFQYAFPLYRLAVESGQTLELIPKNIAGSGRYNFGNPPAPYGTVKENNGYYMNESFGHTSEQSPYTYTPDYTYNASTGYLGTQRFAMYVGPASYYLTGINSFFIDDKGVVWQRDLGCDASGTAYYWNTAYGAGILKSNSWVVTE